MQKEIGKIRGVGSKYDASRFIDNL